MKRYYLAFLLYSVSVCAHEAELEGIEVIEHEESQGLVDFVPSVTKLKGEELNKRRQTSIGDTLSSQVGVQSTSFGPSASRPVIRGLDGDRIKILQNSLGTLDASTQSLDHAIPVDTLTIDQMEIVRGPMSLLYGPSAVGGVVNLVTNRIHYEFEEGFFSKVLVQGETVNNGISSAAHLNYGKNKWMFHLDGSTRNLTEQKIPGYARTSKLRKTDPQAAEVKGKLLNSFNKQDNLAFAVSRIIDRGYYGLSFNHFNTLYGSVADPNVAINMTQNRFEFHGEYRPQGGLLRKVKLKSALSDYFHRELDGDITGTTFRNRGHETRLDALNQSNHLNGVTGVQTQFYDFAANGDEAFLPATRNTKTAIYTFQQYSLGKNALRASLRVEATDIKKNGSQNFGVGDKKNYLASNTSLGHCYDFSRNHTLETTLSYTERAPTFQELYANGEHVATGTFEQGQSDLKIEKATSLEVTHKMSRAKNIFTGSIYSQIFKDYVSLNPTGAISGGVPVYSYQQVNALFYGIDLENKFEMNRMQKGSLFLLNKFDFVQAKNTNSGKNLPRISPPRVSAGIEYQTNKWLGDIEVQYVADQTNIAPVETRTVHYTLTNLGYTYHFVGERNSVEFFARVRNIFNVEARNHVSTLKDVAPLPGRNFILGAQMQI
jgi:iron complex outermembrane receptor protein